MNLRRLPLPVLMTLVALQFGVSALAAENVFPYAYQQQTLANGLSVVMIPMPSPGLVSYYSVVRTGSRDEVEPGRSGYAHFFEHMMFRGTTKYPGSVYDRIVTSIGAAPMPSPMPISPSTISPLPRKTWSE